MFIHPINNISYKGIEIIPPELQILFEEENEKPSEPSLDVESDEIDEGNEIQDLMKFLEAETAMHSLIQKKSLYDEDEMDMKKTHIPSYNEIASIYKRKQTEGKIIDVKA